MRIRVQGSLLDLDDDAPAPMPLRPERIRLSHGAWVDVQHGWLTGAGELFTRLAQRVPWRAERRRMYDRTVDVPRLLCFYREGAGLPDPALAACRDMLSCHYRAELGEPFATAGLCLYRDGRDSVAWHGDTIGRGARQDTIVAILSLGEARPLTLRPRPGGGSVDGESGNTDRAAAGTRAAAGPLRYSLGHGDLLVMGGSCQRTWEHAVPKSARPTGPRISVQFRPRGVRLPDTVRGGIGRYLCQRLGLSAVRNTPLLVATDLDGTIVPLGGSISPRTVAAFARVERAGGRFVVVTGRPPRVMNQIAAAFGHAGTAICANGALAYDMRTGAVSELHLIPAGNIAAAAKALRAAIPDIGIAVEYADGHAADKVYQAATWELNRAVPRVSDDELFARPGAKLLGRLPGSTPDELLALAAPATDGIVTVSHSNGMSLIEASALGVSKASAVAELAASQGIGPESVLAFGDMPNDLPLLAWAGTSCAVSDAHPDVLAAATHVIGACADDGVAAFLEELYAADA